MVDDDRGWQRVATTLPSRLGSDLDDDDDGLTTRSLSPSKGARALVRCAVRTLGLLARGCIRQPQENLGRDVRFADGTSATVYRETVVDRPPPTEPAVLVVCFRLRRVHGERLHALFRFESELNTVLFAGFPGLVSKLWLRHDQYGVYRGLYQWDDPALAGSYARALWWALVLVSEPGSIHYRVLPGLRRDELLGDPAALGCTATGSGSWWCPVGGDFEDR